MNAPRTSLAITSLILLFASPALTQTQPGATGVIDARPTGLDAAGATLALGGQDARWEVSDDLGATWVAAIYGQNNYCGSCGGRWLDWPLGDDMVSRGITHPSHVEARIPGRTFSWRQRFVLPPGALVDTARIAYTVGYDDYSRNAADDGNLSGCDHVVWLNGTPYETRASGNHHRTECEGEIPAGAAFVEGENVLEFRIYNEATYYGFRVEAIEGTYDVGCGDGAPQDAEECDDGNAEAGDGCSECVIDPGFVCAGVPSVCRLEPRCGDGRVDEEVGEGCDDGAGVDGDGCSADCRVEPSYMCLGAPSVCVPLCGDGRIDEGEECDDGDGDFGDGCSACSIDPGFECEGAPSACRPEPRCGDGAIDAGEACDDGNVDPDDGCDAECAVEFGWACVGQPSVCERAWRCGDGLVDVDEACDDANTEAGDGCSSSCEVEPGFTCAGAPSFCESEDACAEGACEASGSGVETDTLEDGCAQGAPGAPARAPALVLFALLVGGLRRWR